MKREQIKNMILTALFMALVIIGSRIYVGTHDTFRFHLGNSMCLLAAFLLSPINAGLAAGVGSMLFDILFYASGPSIFVTLFTKFVMGYVASIIFFRFKSKDIVATIFSGVIGEVAYIILYAFKTYIERRYIMGITIEAVIPILLTKVGAAVFNAIFAVVISTLLYKIVSKIKI